MIGKPAITTQDYISHRLPWIIVNSFDNQGQLRSTKQTFRYDIEFSKVVYYDDASVDISKVCIPVQGIHITPIIPEHTKGAAFCFNLLIDDI